jgi:antitoxin YefM
MAITATAARKDLYRLIEEVNLDRTDIEITSKNGSAFLVSAHEYNALRETAYLLRSPANAARLAASAQQVRDGSTTPRALIETSDEPA